MQHLEQTLVWFDGVQDSVLLERIDDSIGGGVQELSAIVVSVIERVTQDDGTPLPEVIGRSLQGEALLRPGHRKLFPSFWHHRSLVSKSIGVLAAGDPSSTMWVMGEYDGGWGRVGVAPRDGQQTELQELVRLKRISAEHYQLLGSTFRGQAQVIYRQKPSDPVLLRDSQGRGHMHGVRFVLFPGIDEPKEVLDRWLSQASVERNSALMKLSISDSMGPGGASGWLGPFGDENREHALVASKDLECQALAQGLAMAYGLRLVRCRCSANEWEMWQSEYELPLMLRDYLRAGP